MNKQRHTRFDCNPGCAVEATVSLIDGKWKCVILNFLLTGTMRFNELRRQMPDVTARMLAAQLRELEADGLVVRKVYAEVPPKVEYSLSELGRSLEPIIQSLKTWGSANLHRFSREAAAPSAAHGAREPSTGRRDRGRVEDRREGQCLDRLEADEDRHGARDRDGWAEAGADRDEHHAAVVRKVARRPDP